MFNGMYHVITSSPNKDGLTAAAGQAAIDGITSAGGSAELIDISDPAQILEPCRVCGNGWGTCRNTAKCVIEDKILEKIQLTIKDSKGVFIITPVYFGQSSERMKYFIDRYRRCEAFRQGGSWAAGKQFNLVAAAGGSGNGTASCLVELENWARHVGAVPQERIGITRFNRETVLKVIEDAGARLVKGEYFGR
ncbi:MAG: flavodoxin family protein [Oscillospiraceae bacterium]|jgi:multimeric flavodoxin WrbA|nr:flavodoxin family protein [Oscillospiraceae bacterium]